MATLLMRLAAPMQSWGDESKYDLRYTCAEPTKSGVIGLVSAALGLERSDPEIACLAQRLRMGVRVDQRGNIMADYHTVHVPDRRHYLEGCDTNGNVIMGKETYVTRRYYICDACFLVGLECAERSILEHISAALAAPIFSLYLGRRACPPTLPLNLGISERTLSQALYAAPWMAADWYRRKYPNARLSIILESESGQPASHSVHDQPISFNQIHREYGFRGLEREQSLLITAQNETQHDPFAIL